MNYIALDSHKKYSLARVEDKEGKLLKETIIEHQHGSIKGFLRHWDRDSLVAVETIGNWYWIVDEIEDAGMEPRLTNARKAKLMMGGYNKTDKLDAKGLNLLQRNGTLPMVWIPPAEVRDKRDIARTRMVLVAERTKLKNRIHATLAKYGLMMSGVKDPFGVEGRKVLAKLILMLPPQTRFTTEVLIRQVDHAEEEIKALEERMKEVFHETEEIKLLRTLPGVGFILSTVIAFEIGDISRFLCAERLASYSGTTPRVHSSGGKTHYGSVRPDVNQYLKWAFREAANVVAVHRKSWKGRHVAMLYERIKARKGHGKAVGAVARHLAEAAYWILTKKEEYKEPKWAKVSSRKA